MKSAIIYATKYGSVAKAAGILKSHLKNDVTMINLAKEKFPLLDEYDTVILGGSIYMGKIQKSLTKFVLANLPTLLKKRTGLFICAGQPEPVRTKELAEAFPVELYNHAIAKEVFGHEYNFDKINFMYKLILRKVAGVTESVFNLSEEKIASFAETIR